MVKIYKQYLPIQPNIPIYTALQGELISVEEQQNHIVAYFDANSQYYHKYNLSNGRDLIHCIRISWSLAIKNQNTF